MDEKQLLLSQYKKILAAPYTAKYSTKGHCRGKDDEKNIKKKFLRQISIVQLSKTNNSKHILRLGNQYS